MLSMEEILQYAQTLGFEHMGPLDPARLTFMPEVREMCASDRCHMYGKCWTCPPGCGTLEEIREKALTYSRGIILQSTGILDDDFDVETMQETEKLHKRRFQDFAQWLRTGVPGCMPMSSGACELCSSCTYPHQPCRFPQKATPSMEACGLLVSNVCLSCGLGYYYGPKTITYSSCVLID